MAGIDLPVRAIGAGGLGDRSHRPPEPAARRQPPGHSGPRGRGLQGDVITLSDLFLFDSSAGVDPDGRHAGRSFRAGCRPGRASPTGFRTSASRARRRSSTPTGCESHPCRTEGTADPRRALGRHRGRRSPADPGACDGARSRPSGAPTETVFDGWTPPEVHVTSDAPGARGPGARCRRLHGEPRRGPASASRPWSGCRATRSRRARDRDLREHGGPVHRGGQGRGHRLRARDAERHEDRRRRLQRPRRWSVVLQRRGPVTAAIQGVQATVRPRSYDGWNLAVSHSRAPARTSPRGRAPSDRRRHGQRGHLEFGSRRRCRRRHQLLRRRRS